MPLVRLRNDRRHVLRLDVRLLDLRVRQFLAVELIGQTRIIEHFIEPKPLDHAVLNVMSAENEPGGVPGNAAVTV